MPYELNSNCVTVVTAEGYSGQLLISGFSRLLTWLCTVVDYTGLHFRAFHLLISAASHDLKETIDKASDSLSVSCGMEPEQEALSIVSFKDWEAASQLIN